MARPLLHEPQMAPPALAPLGGPKAALGSVPPADLRGTVLRGTYRVLRHLGGGGMGTVYEAEHLRLHRRVAVKVLGSATPELVARFEQEAEIVSQLAHPNIVTVLDFDTTEAGAPYLVLELLHGETLAARLDRSAPLETGEATSITLQAAAALAAAHRAGVVHRDLKPSNVFLVGDPSEPPFVKLLDFGISKSMKSVRKLTQAQTLLGTPEYMSPEQAAGRGQTADARTDQYALAVLAYEMLTGDQPFARSDIAETLERVLTLEAPKASSVVAWLSETVDDVLARAMSKAPDGRYWSIEEFATALADALRPAPAKGGERPRRTPPPSGWPPSSVDTPLTTRTSPAFGMNRFTTKASPRDAEAAPSQTTHPDLCSPGRGDAVASRVARARASLDAGAVAAAASHAGAAFDLFVPGSPEDEAVLRASEPVLARAFLQRLRSPSQRLLPAAPPDDLSLSPRAVYLLTRIDPDMTVDEAIDVSSMPRLEALRRLVQLVECGALRLR